MSISLLLIKLIIKLINLIEMAVIPGSVDPNREKALQDYRKKLLEHRDIEQRLKEGIGLGRVWILFCY